MSNWVWEIPLCMLLAGLAVLLLVVLGHVAEALIDHWRD